MKNDLLFLVIETSILRHNIGSAFFEKIERGDIHELELEAVESFLAACPKEAEVEALHTAIQKQGFYDLTEALEKLECGKEVSSCEGGGGREEPSNHSSPALPSALCFCLISLLFLHGK